MKNPLIPIALGLLKFYKVVLSPPLSVIGVKCRHMPSCSSYSQEAIIAHGLWAGCWMTLARLIRCNPFGTHGVDNVPECITKPPIWAPWRYGLWRGTHNNASASQCHDHSHIP
ncbi:MAG: membrane protein insertion efficiency factor YidD [Maricaulaceae bacterium]